MEVQTLLNQAALDIPEVKAALSRWTMAQAWQDTLRAYMTVGSAALIVGTQDDIELDAVAIVTLPQAFTDNMPWVVHFHNDGSRALSKAMIEAVLDFVRGSGYTTFKAFNQSGLPDKVWLKVFRDGGKPHFIGSAYVFELKEDISDGSNSSGDSGPRDRKQPVRKTRKRDDRRAVPDKPANKPASEPKLKRSGKSNNAVVQPTRANHRRRSR